MNTWIPGLVGVVAGATIIFTLWMMNRQSQKHVASSLKSRAVNVHETDRVAIIKPESVPKVGYRDGVED